MPPSSTLHISDVAFSMHDFNGQIVGEKLSMLVFPDTTEKLDFKIKPNKLDHELLKIYELLVRIPEKQNPEKIDPISTVKSTTKMSSKFKIYDQSADIRVPFSNNIERPKHLRQCLEILNSSDEPEQIAVAHQTITSLIENQPAETESLAKEIISTYLTRENRYEMPDFKQTRESVVLATVKSCPDSVFYMSKMLLKSQTQLFTKAT